MKHDYCDSPIKVKAAHSKELGYTADGAALGDLGEGQAGALLGHVSVGGRADVRVVGAFPASVA